MQFYLLALTSIIQQIKNNLSDLEKQLIQANKELKQLRMENDILKQAALIIGRK
ncbi:hypothetical protein [Spiroplasma ixodetis]|uniref:Transposase n=1 Tax=Spiroplasma ixodetis TaxID=2141 RepID=A0ABM8BWK8_9MOLU|nr:hypothetical protein [Spiroplasma ixodetis]BDT04159.1 hypothetical protein SHM_18050 [Spiroplasma ixodetis]